MKLTSLPPVLITILDASPEIGLGVKEALEPALEHRQEGRQFKIEVCVDTKDALLWLKHALKGEVEPCLFVSDTIGFEPAGRGVGHEFRPLFPHQRVVLHSEGATEDPAIVAKLVAEDIIDDFVKKNSPEQVAARLAENVDKYFSRSSIRTMSRYLAFVCNAPSEPFYKSGDKYLSMLDIYWSIATGAPNADELDRHWNDLLLSRM